MTPKNGRPSKRLVPRMAGDRTCDHVFVEEEGMTLEVDCTECSGPQTMDNARCASGIIDILASGVLPDTVVLRRYIDVRYRSERIVGLCAAAASLAALRRLKEQPGEASDRRCRTCPASKSRLASELIRRVRADPASFFSSQSSTPGGLRKELSSIDCPRLGRCIETVTSGEQTDRGDS